MATVSPPRHRRRLGVAGISTAHVRLCADGLHARTCALFPVRHRRQRKSVFLSTLSALLADYAKTAPTSSFTASLTEQHPTDLAGLRGARFVTAIETEEGAKWAEAKIKSLTGGDKIAARFMRCDFFEFTPAFKLVIAGNHKPGLCSVDEAIRRRLHLVPFTETIPENERDPSLGEKLRAEYSGILAWAIQGCLDWQREGLKPPAAVREATTAYRRFRRRHWPLAGGALYYWAEMLDGRRRAICRLAGLVRADWRARRVTEALYAGLEARGFQRQRTNRAKGFIGIALREDVVPDVPGSPVFTVSRAHGRPI